MLARAFKLLDLALRLALGVGDLEGGLEDSDDVLDASWGDEAWDDSSA